MMIKPHSVILFQGDSITDAGRSRISIGPNSRAGLGNGYPHLVAENLQARFPERFLQFYNRGVSGDRIAHLTDRWESDTLRLLPDLISVLVGVNDTWNNLFLGIGASPQEFQGLYGKLLRDTRQRLPAVEFILCDPFVLLTGEVNQDWEGDISQRRIAVEELAREFGAIHVPFQAALDEAVNGGIPPHQLLEDGVHPTERGHQLLADCWLQAVLTQEAKP